MKTKSAFRLLLPVCLLALLCLSAFAAGETVISDAAALGRLMDDPAAWSGSYRLGADIDLGSVKQSPIGNYETPFTGSFDGAGHTISGLNIKADGTAGLFGVLSGASVTDLTVKGSVLNSFAATDAETKLDEKYPGTGGIAGVALSGVAVFLYQGLITLCASFIAPFLSDVVIAEMKCVGSLLIIGLSFNMLGMTKIKVMNYVPAVFFPILLCTFM